MSEEIMGLVCCFGIPITILVIMIIITWTSSDKSEPPPEFPPGRPVYPCRC